MTASNKASQDLLGFRVSIFGNNAFAGAEGDNSGGFSDNGAVYVYRSVNGGKSWPSAENQILTASDKGSNSYFGWAISVSGNIALIGAEGHTIGGTSSAGAAYIFNTTNGGVTWSEAQILTAAVKFQDAGFGCSASISGNVALVGASLHDLPGKGDAGAAYLFQSPDGGKTWPASETQMLTASNELAGSRFGSSVSVSGNTAFVGAEWQTVGANSQGGSAYIFRKSLGGGSWNEVQILKTTNNAWFGVSVDISNNIALVGARKQNAGGVSTSGAVYVYRSSDGGATWNETQELSASNAAANDAFGSAVAISDNTAVIGAFSARPGSLSQAGAAYIFELPTPVVPPSKKSQSSSAASSSANDDANTAS